MFSRKKNQPVSQFAIDPGAFHTRFCSPTEGLLLDQPSIAALDMDHPIGGSKAIESFGDQADELISSGLDGLRPIQPIQSDRHNELGLSAKMLGFFLSHARRSGLIGKYPEILLMQSHDCSSRVSAQLQAVCKQSGARKVRVLDAALAAFYATGLKQSAPCIMIDFGATESRIFAIDSGDVVHYQSLPCGGDALDTAIATGLLERFSVQVSDESARDIKHCVAAATPQSMVRCTRKSCQIDCLSVKTNTIKPFRVSSETINQILTPTLQTLSDSIRAVLENIDKPLKDAAYETGIQICGGGALLPRLDQLVMTATNLPVELVRRPLNSNIRGAASSMTEEQINALKPDLVH